MTAPICPTCNQGWNRDMEAAPRDRSLVLMCDDDGALYGGYWETDFGCWAVHCGQPCVQSPEPIAWMRAPALPAPPTPPETDEGEAK